MINVRVNSLGQFLEALVFCLAGAGGFGIKFEGWCRYDPGLDDCP